MDQPQPPALPPVPSPVPLVCACLLPAFFMLLMFTVDGPKGYAPALVAALVAPVVPVALAARHAARRERAGLPRSLGRLGFALVAFAASVGLAGAVFFVGCCSTMVPR
jgi:hypothetical protein